MSKHNYFFRFLIKINQFINSLLKRNLNKLNVTNLKKLIVNNKFFLIIFGAIILFFSYLSIPNIFNQNEISAEIKKNLLNELNLEFNFEKKLHYKFFPRPHFITNELSIIFNDNKISEIKKIKIYVSLDNLFSLKKMKVKDIIIENGNFNLTDSLIYVKDGKLILDASSEINISNIDEVYKFLLTPKKYRKKISTININFTYLFDEKIININDIKVDGTFNENLIKNFNQILLKENNLQNKIYFKKLINDAIRSYAG